jgi:hypothetical protein
MDVAFFKIHVGVVNRPQGKVVDDRRRGPVYRAARGGAYCQIGNAIEAALATVLLGLLGSEEGAILSAEANRVANLLISKGLWHLAHSTRLHYSRGLVCHEALAAFCTNFGRSPARRQSCLIQRSRRKTGAELTDKV